MDLNTLLPENQLRPDPTGSRIFVVSQVNGNLANLKLMVEQIETSGTFAKNDKIVFLGNYIYDEGDSKQIIQYLREYQNKRKDQVIILRGQNEQKMIYSKEPFINSDLGKNTSRSYRITQTAPFNALHHNALDVRGFVSDRQWLQNLPLFFQSERFYFVHSGVNPALSLKEQVPMSLMYISEYFYNSKAVYSHVIVHSHKEQKHNIKNNRIGVGQKGVLSCLVLNDTKYPDGIKNLKMIEDYISVDNSSGLMIQKSV